MPHDKFTQADLKRAITRLSMLRFFPSDVDVRAEISRELARMVPSMQALEWLVDTMVTKVGSWYGPRELRGVLVTAFPSADGVDALCNETPGFTGAELEGRYFQENIMPENKLSQSSQKLLAGIAKEWPQ